MEKKNGDKEPDKNDLQLGDKVAEGSENGTIETDSLLSEAFDVASQLIILAKNLNDLFEDTGATQICDESDTQSDLQADIADYCQEIDDFVLILQEILDKNPPAHATDKIVDIKNAATAVVTAINQQQYPKNELSDLILKTTTMLEGFAPSQDGEVMKMALDDADSNGDREIEKGSETSSLLLDAVGMLEQFENLKTLFFLYRVSSDSSQLSLDEDDEVSSCFRELGKGCTRLRSQGLEGVDNIERATLELNEGEGITEKKLNALELELRRVKELFEELPYVEGLELRSSTRVMDPETYKKIIELRRLASRGDEGEIRRYIETNFPAFDAKEHYPGLWNSKDENKHNFMRPTEEPHHLIRNFMMEILAGEAAQHGPPLSVMEIGTGIGNDARFMFRAAHQNLVQIARYHGIEISPTPAQITRERLEEVLKQLNMLPYPKVEISEVDFIGFIEQMATQYRARVQEVIINRPVDAILCINAGHYQMREEFMRLLRNINDILRERRGYLVIAQKTPGSDSAKDHSLILNEDGYKLYLHLKENILRAFIERQAFINMLEQARFEIITQYQKTVAGYDFPGQNEKFSCVVARPIVTKT